MRKHIIWLLVGLLCLLLLCFGLRGCDSSNTPKWAMHGVNAQELAVNSDLESAPSDSPTQDTVSPSPVEETAQVTELPHPPSATPEATGEDSSDTSPVVEVIGDSESTADGQPEEGPNIESADAPASTPEQVNAPEDAGRELYISKPYMRGADVKNLQDMLIAKGYDPGKADGIYGPRTEQAVKRFQSAEGLYSESDAQSGIVDEATWRMLRGGESQ